jgi:5-deoxy-glucuronate isomerase
MTSLCWGNPGGWTAWPPNEHAAKREEIYVYFDMGDAFEI